MKRQRDGVRVFRGGRELKRMEIPDELGGGVVRWWDDAPEASFYWDGVLVAVDVKGGVEFLSWWELFPPEWRHDCSTGELIE